MANENPQVHWTDEQWARVRQAVQDEAHRARVAATFLPLVGPLPGDTDFVRADVVHYGKPGDAHSRLHIDDTRTVLLSTLQVKVFLRGAQAADPDLTSALQLFRRAANVLARLEDAIVFNGQAGARQGPRNGNAGLPPVWEVLGGQATDGLLATDPAQWTPVAAQGDAMVTAVSAAIGALEGKGHFGPFALVLGQDLFTAVQTPNAGSLVLPQDRILPFLGGGALLRSSTLPAGNGVLVALGAAPVELVVATDVTMGFIQMTMDPLYAFRVYEKMVLRIKEPDAIVSFGPPAPAR